MYIDARQVDPGTEIDCDICIVGAGAAGITLARELDSSGTRICLLESGGRVFDQETNALYKGDNVGLPYFGLDVCQLRAFGGNTNAWGGWCRPLDPIDFAFRPWVPNSGWPISRADLDAYYPKAQKLCQIRQDSYAIEEWRAAIARAGGEVLPFDPNLLETCIYQFSPPTRFGRLYADDIGRSASVRCFLHANVVNIAASSDARHVTKLDVACLSGNSFSVRAKVYVLAAGGTENPRLLLVSRDVAPHGLGNENDLVGRFFMEHPHVQRRIIPLSPRAPIMLYGLKFRDKGFAARLSLPRALQEQEQLLNYSANIHPVYFGHRTEGWMALRKLVLSLSRSRSGDPYLRFPPYGAKNIDPTDASRILRHLPTVTLAGFLQLFQPNRFITGYTLESKSEQAPNPDSRLVLKHERDALGVNRVEIAWRTLPIDRRTVVRGEEIVGSELERLRIGRLEPLPPELVEEWPSNLEGGWHQLGMTRMHEDPRHGVVDATCRVHGISNLYIAGGSVFPTGGAAAPTLTIVALALRLADQLKQRFWLDGVHIDTQQRPSPQPVATEVELATARTRVPAVAAAAPPPPVGS